MPNGGSDCCGTCWFNRANDGQRGYRNLASDERHYCEIRGLDVDDNPFYTYCANHPHRRPDRDPIPIGPVLRYAGDGWSNDRAVWVPSPDTEEVRQHLLDLLSEIFTHVANDRYPIGTSVAEVIMQQLGEFREPRAVRHLTWIAENCPPFMAAPARAALERIEQAS